MRFFFALFCYCLIGDISLLLMADFRLFSPRAFFSRDACAAAAVRLMLPYASHCGVRRELTVSLIFLLFIDYACRRAGDMLLPLPLSPLSCRQTCRSFSLRHCEMAPLDAFITLYFAMMRICAALDVYDILMR